MLGKILLSLVGIGTGLGLLIAGTKRASAAPATAGAGTSAVGPEPMPKPQDPNALALAALKTADPGQMNLAATILAGNGHLSQAAAVNRSMTWVREVTMTTPNDVAGAMVASMRTLDRGQCYRTADAYNSNYPRLAAELRTIGDVIRWLQSGGSPTDVPVPSAPTAVAPASAQQGANVVLPTELLGKLGSTIASGDLAAMSILADQLDQAGLKAQAADLRATIARLRAEQLAQQASTPVPTAGAGQIHVTSPDVVSPAPAVVTPPVVTPPVVITASEPSVAEVAPADSIDSAGMARQKALAAQVVQTVAAAKAGGEDKAVVREFQTAVAPDRAFKSLVDAGLKVDGLYGTQTARAVAQFGHVPPNPLYAGQAGLRGGAGWTSYVNDVRGYRSFLSERKLADPQRADEWGDRLSKWNKKHSKV